MASIKTITAGKSQPPQSSILRREMRRLRTMQIVFAIFCMVLILLLAISLISNP